MMEGSGSPRLTLLVGVVILLSCGPAPPKNPFDGTAGRRPNSSAHRHRVLFEVSCRGCAISWRVGHESGTAMDDGSWSHSTYVYTDFGETVATLTATPTQGGRPVRWVRIRVNGKIAAQERAEDEPGVARPNSRWTLSVQTPIPPP
jgi:hypothetical protein